MFCLGLRNSWTRNALRLDAGSYSTGQAEPREIGGKSVGEVHHRRGKSVFGEPSAYGKPRLRIEMFAKMRIASIEPAFVLLNEPKANLGFAEAAGDEDGVAGACAAAEDGATATAFAYDGHINEDLVAASGVAAGGWAVQFSRSSQQPAQEFLKPLAGESCGQSQAQEEAAGCGSHGGEVACCPSEALPADGMRWMAVEEKVSALQEPVASQDGFVTGDWPPDCGVITDGDAQ